MAGFPVDAAGNVIPLLRPSYGNSVEQAVTTTTGTAIPVTSGKGGVVRLFAIGTDILYVAGGASVALPDAGDGMVISGTYLEVPLASGETHIRCAARSGSGTARVEILV